MTLAEAKVGDIVDYDGKRWRVTFVERGCQVGSGKTKPIPGHLGLTEVREELSLPVIMRCDQCTNLTHSAHDRRVLICWGIKGRNAVVSTDGNRECAPPEWCPLRKGDARE